MQEEIYSLAAAVGATDADLLALAQLIAGDHPIQSLHDLNAAGLAELAATLRLYGTVPKHAFVWLEELAAL